MKRRKKKNINKCGGKAITIAEHHTLNDGNDDEHIQRGNRAVEIKPEIRYPLDH